MFETQTAKQFIAPSRSLEMAQFNKPYITFY